MSLVDAVRLMAEAQEFAVVVTDGELKSPGPRVLYVNPAFERMTGYAAEELIGGNLRILQGADTSLAARKALGRALRASRPHETTLVNYRKSGEAYRCHIQVFPVCDDAGRLINAIAIEREVRRGPGRPSRRHGTLAQTPADARAREAQRQGADVVMRKPYSGADLAHAIAKTTAVFSLPSKLRTEEG